MKKKTIYFITLALALLTMVFACQKLENAPTFPANTNSFTASLSTASVSVTAQDSLTNALTISWNDPKFTAGLDQTKFVIMIDSTGKNFSKSFYAINLGAVLKDTLKAKEINNIALKLGGKIGQTISLDVVVVASAANGSQPKSSAVVKLTVSPYGDLDLSTTNNSVVCTPATATENADTLSWTEAFNGYTGVKTYVLQYAKGGTNFASPTTISVTGYSQTFTVRELNLMAQALGVSAPSTGDVDFRIKATTETGTPLYSNVKTVSVTTYVAYNSIGLIGNFTNWGNDVDMYRPDPVNAPADWTVTCYITSGPDGVKFRADDAWAASWGAASFPSGTAVLNGPNVPMTTTGYYKVDFNVASGAYSFTAIATTVYPSVGVVGAQTNWGNPDPNNGNAVTPDFALTQDPNNNQLWTGTFNLTAGDLKFRVNNDWTVNWGPGPSDGQLSGWATGGGNMNIPVTGNYFVSFNSATLEYFFANIDNNSGAATPYNQIGIIGDATPNGWGSDTYLIQNPSNPYKWSAKVVLTTWVDGAKFRANTDWTTNWGGNSVPSGIGTLNGPNIPVIVGTSQITFNSATGEYSFTY